MDVSGLHHLEVPPLDASDIIDLLGEHGLPAHVARGDLAVAVFVDVGTSGSGTAGPIIEAFLRAAD